MLRLIALILTQLNKYVYDDRHIYLILRYPNLGKVVVGVQYNGAVVGRVIYNLRKQRGVTQEVLSGFAVIARTHLTMIEKGTKQPNLETLWRIAMALNMRPSELIACIEAEMSREQINSDK